MTISTSKGKYHRDICQFRRELVLKGVTMNNNSKANKIAWEYKSYDFWMQRCGAPKDFAKKLVANPKHSIRLEKDLLGEVKGKKIANVLGSNGRKAVPLAIMGADVTVIDISETNMKYALELANEAGVEIRYTLCDFMEFDTSLDGNNDFDILYLEGGILHYFDEIN
jgi:2-polyprenyl-3-methyl-5-hydroxy-6-metoxy-1,4-benzoquinol methylase